MFLHDGKSPWSPDLVDDDKTRIKAFRKKLKGASRRSGSRTQMNSRRLLCFTLRQTDRAWIWRATTQVAAFDLEKYFAALGKRYGVLALEGLTPPQKEDT